MHRFGLEEAEKLQSASTDDVAPLTDEFDNLGTCSVALPGGRGGSTLGGIGGPRPP